MKLTDRKPSLLHFCRLAPSWFTEALMLTGEDSNHIDNGTWQNRTSIETQGDLNELWDILRRSITLCNDEELEDIVNIFKFTMASYGTITIEEYREIPTIEEFQGKYPNLSRSMETWAWS